MNLEFVAATENDSPLVYKWRNDPRTKEHFFSKKEISYEEHSKWFADILNNSDEFLLLTRRDKVPVGVIRLTRLISHEICFGQVGLYLDPNLHGEGIGGEMLSQFANQWCPRNAANVEVYIAKVSMNNIASQKCFDKAGYRRAGIHIKGEIDVRDLADMVSALPKALLMTPCKDAKPDQDVDHYLYIKLIK